MFATALACSGGQHEASRTTVSPSEQQIRTARATFTEAIARRDTLAIAQVLMPDYHVVTSLNGQTHGRREHLRTWVDGFKRDSTETYVRRSREVRVNERWGQAEELGDWWGSRMQREERVRVSGTYGAKWVRGVDGAWRLLSETFTLMSCEGSALGCEPPTP